MDISVRRQSGSKLPKTQNSFGISGSGIVAVIDTGADATHQVLQDVLLSGYDFTRNQKRGSELTDLSEPGDVDHDASPARVNQSTMAVVNGNGVTTLSQPQYKDFGHGTKGYRNRPSGGSNRPDFAAQSLSSGWNGESLWRSTRDLLRGRKRARVLNMSFDVSTSALELDKADQNVARHGAVSVASVGNDGQAVMVYPAGLKNVMGSASTTNSDTILPGLFVFKLRPTSGLGGSPRRRYRHDLSFRNLRRGVG
jgi:Subtilase family